MPVNNTSEKFVHELADLYDAEHQFLEAQREMVAKATDPRLATMIEEHIVESEQQIKNLEKVFSAVGERPKRQHCDGAEGLVSEARKTIAEAVTDALRDSFITGAAVKAEHYEMVSYADLIEGAELMGDARVLRYLEENRDQEVRTARRLERAGPRLLRVAQETSV